MLRRARYVIVAAAFTAIMHGDDITVPLEDGNIVIRNAGYVRSSRTNYSLSELVFTILNNTSDGWDLKLRLDITRRCNDGEGEAHQSSRTVEFSLRQGASKSYQDNMPLSSETRGCVLEKVGVSLISAENRKLRINGTTGERIDLERQRQIEAEAQAKKDAIESARQKRLAAEQKKRNAELDARNAKERAERDAKDAEDKRKLRANCTVIYQNTIDKKLKDLTVREEEQVRACQALGLYPPQ